MFEREDGKYGWFEILDESEVEPDDEVFGDFSSLGNTIIRKNTGETIDISIEDSCCSLDLALRHVFPDIH